ncbi:MAG: putative AGC family protein kinase, partial [Streblomastix strix]
ILMFILCILSSIAGFILTIVFGIGEDDPDTKSLSIGAGVVLIVVGYVFFLISLIFEIKLPCKYSKHSEGQQNGCLSYCRQGCPELIRSSAQQCGRSCIHCCSCCLQCIPQSASGAVDYTNNCVPYTVSLFTGMDKFHFVYFVFSVFQILLGVHSLIMPMGFYIPSYGFGLLSAFWFVNAIWLLTVGIEGIVYSLCIKGKWYKIMLTISTICVSVFFFWSLLMMKPCGLILLGSQQCLPPEPAPEEGQPEEEPEPPPGEQPQEIPEDIPENMTNYISSNVSGYNISGNGTHTWNIRKDVFVFAASDIFAQSVVSGIKIFIHFAMDQEEDIPYVNMFAVALFIGFGSLVFLVLQSLYPIKYLMFPAIFNFGIDLVFIGGLFIGIISREFRVLASFFSIVICFFTAVAGIIVTVIFSKKEINPVTQSLSLGAGIAQLIIGLILITISILFYIIKPCRYSKCFSNSSGKRFGLHSREIVDIAEDNYTPQKDPDNSPFQLSYSQTQTSASLSSHHQQLSQQQQQQQQSSQHSMHLKQNSQMSTHIKIDSPSLSTRLKIESPTLSIDNTSPTSQLSQQQQQSVQFQQQSSQPTSTSSLTPLDTKFQQIPELTQNGYEKIKKIGSREDLETIWLAKLTVSDELFAIKELRYNSTNIRDRLINDWNLMNNAYSKMIFTVSRSKLTYFPFIEPKEQLISESLSTVYYVLEYCSGGDLRSYIRTLQHQQIRIDEELVWKLIKQIAFALNMMHTLKIVHESLTPGNVMLNQDVSIKLSSYGLSPNNHETDINTTSIDGSQIYIAPELQPGIFRNEDEVIQINPDYTQTNASDIWSFGIIIFELMSWHHPFSAEGKIKNEIKIIERIKSKAPSQLPEEYSDYLKKLIMTMLEK